MGSVKVNNTQGLGNKRRGVTNFIAWFTYKYAICIQFPKMDIKKKQVRNHTDAKDAFVVFIFQCILGRELFSDFSALSVFCNILLLSSLFSLLAKCLTLQQLTLQPAAYLSTALIKSAMHAFPLWPAGDPQTTCQGYQPVLCRNRWLQFCFIPSLLFPQANISGSS